jgi:hypothetical protein
MKKSEEYRSQAAECIALARRTEGDEEKDQLMKMAAVWGRLAAYCETRQPETLARFADRW